jgi:hypothetical protein
MPQMKNLMHFAAKLYQLSDLYHATTQYFRASAPVRYELKALLSITKRTQIINMQKAPASSDKAKDFSQYRHPYYPRHHCRRFLLWLPDFPDPAQLYL